MLRCVLDTFVKVQWLEKNSVKVELGKAYSPHSVHCLQAKPDRIRLNEEEVDDMS